MKTNPTTQNQTYVIYVYEKKAATYDEHDGYGDYPRYGFRRFCEVGASNEDEALKIAGVRDNFNQLFIAKLADNA